MNGEFIAFIALALVAIGGGVLMLNVTKVVHMIVSLVFTFISIAGLYVLLSAEFIAGVQVLIYSGAITIIMLFGIMLTKHQDQEQSSPGIAKRLLIFAGIAAFAFVFYLGIYQLDFGTEAEALHENNTEQIGVSLFTEYVIPFELTSVILLVALIGAIVLAKRDDQEEANDK
ncbi:NADH-quinone oxidoreductase subunit J [Metabacillus arenae]|uniref:NADH-quinone oxidoreductase subunit J n=1 Tax=Metabacillus arenae TaxID=2771434 RepID=A0A926NGW7_9BACI|nr:NADH-quinone oxidoreductase subunit J [Metabacillus arenae]MBD1383234.1 NADH-quinone oxidoreductase subunit J [Metabacillus arenae]